MAISRERRLNQTGQVTAKFPSGDELEVEYRRSGNSYGRVKQLVEVSREAKRQTNQVTRLKKQLERDGIGDDKRKELVERLKSAPVETKESLEKELCELDEKRAPILDEIEQLELSSADSIEALIDWMAGGENSPAAILTWKYFEDEAQTKQIPVSRPTIEEFEGVEIATLANAILEEMNVGESKRSS